MSRQKTITLTPVALDVDYISTSEALTTPWALQLDGITTFTTPQHVTLTSSTDESGQTFTIVGTDRYGGAQSEGLVGGTAAATVTSVLNYATVTSITGTADASLMTAGVDGTCESGWFVLNYRGNDFSVGLGLDFTLGTGVGTASVEHTFQNVLTTGFVEGDATVYVHDSIVSKSADFDGNYTNPPVACRLAVTAYTSGSISLHVVQSGSGS